MGAPLRQEHPDDWRPNPGPQTRFLSLTCFEALYGGAAGGGKSDALLVDAIRYVGRGYGPGYAALLLRREFPDLEMSLMRRAPALYLRLGGRWNGASKTWTFPAGETVRFGHCQHEQDVHQYQGAEFQFVGFDELTSFTEYQYTYLISRIRSPHGIPLRLRAATNPGGVGHDWVFRRWAPWLDPESATRGDPGQVLYFARAGDREIEVTRDTVGAFGRTFVPARLSDNPYLAADGNYERALDELDEVTRGRLKSGDWLIQPAPGMYFRRAWFEVVPAAPANAARVRHWDRAATPEKKSNDPDWTVGLKFSRTPDGIYYVEDVVRLRDSPHAVERAIRSTAALDGVGTMVSLAEDPGQAGKFEAAYYARALAGYNVRTAPERGDKVLRSLPVSAQAQAGNVKLVRGPWVEAFLHELERFPQKGVHDDQVDALSGAFAALTTGLAPTCPPSMSFGGRRI